MPVQFGAPPSRADRPRARISRHPNGVCLGTATARGLQFSGGPCTWEINVKERGFTLLESVAVLVIGGIILASTLPGFVRYQSVMRNGQAREQLIQDVRSARQKAVTQRTPVIMAFGDGVTTADVTTYTVHIDVNGDRLFQSGEPRKSYTLPKDTKLAQVSLQPVDSLFFDISGVLVPGTLGGSLVTVSRSITDTLLVSGAGMVYRQ